MKLKHPELYIISIGVESNFLSKYLKFYKTIRIGNI